MAKLAGVSAVTVSRALRHPRMVSSALRARIDAAVSELAYVPDVAASRLASARTHAIGVIVSSLTNGVFADYLRALHDTLLPAGFQVVVFSSRYSADEEEKVIATLLGQHPEAIIIAGIDQTPHGRRLLERSGVPVIQTFELTDDPIDINVGLSQRQAGYAATQYLIDRGHRRIGYTAARLDARAHARMEGYNRAMADARLPTDGLVATTPRPSSVSAGGELIGAILDRRSDLEALFCCDDNLALGALFECQRRDIAVPDQISIIGFNDLEFAACAHPPISSVATPRYEMGRLAAEIVMKIIEIGERPADRRIDVGFTISERGSTMPVARPQARRALSE
ncbi:LacI family DNA-binding transcriptional regulator [Dongia deserti]|uniref:LacI family DNA-binding transcriptional regulator n=1 Tax=Dongia deserti TaxID=2268030 RepID=UPI0025484A99|nr:LacI family DNA-binding transcriptional regulator [Dongia deserti]